MKKAKVRRIKNKSVQTNKTVQTDKPENNNNEQLSLSAELLKEIISTLFLGVNILLVFSSFYELLKAYTYINNCFCICFLSMVLLDVLFTLIISVCYFKKRKCKTIFRWLFSISLIIFGVCIIVSVIMPLPQLYITFLNDICVAYLCSFLSYIFIAVYIEILQEKDRFYIVNYFSALTSLAALIVALVALFK